MSASTNKSALACYFTVMQMPMRQRDLQALTEIFDDFDTEELMHLEAIAPLEPAGVLEPWEETGWETLTESQYEMEGAFA
ncbi:hypothetical protein H6F50_03235 [Coleofasciculus sp. FACHB-712]|uniref:hypothetical protein n=1 Tax=Coleofasciculus sp. FACHB-712 TaxID=2692789 RepID=UPI001682D71B|nr:hypothetical protein [Coleofasciculus sp. FACHB-712]MBD1941374.1 hypothetical protein [Coleofasciculus sp. FACHB-712]